MTNTSDKFSGGGGDVAPSPRSPASSGNGKKTQETASVPIENCLTEGVQPINLRTKLRTALLRCHPTALRKLRTKVQHFTARIETTAQ